jgi:serine/threonine protein kinase/tetratricopeptide (TPR) repeat protein
MTLTLPERFEVKALLGEGGSGHVYHVYDSMLDRDVALKIVPSAESKWLYREFDTLRQVRHENLVQVFDWGTTPAGENYYTMEWVDGSTWGSHMGEPQEPEFVRHVLACLLRALAHLHCHNELHGDIKPGNVLLGTGGLVKLSDVGMGGEGNLPAGTPGYTAPEIWEGKVSDVRSDIYSIGVLAYEAITGHHPFEGRTVRDAISGQLEGWVPSPGVYGLGIPADLERAVMRAMERDPSLRQASADEFLEGLGVRERIGEFLAGKFVARRGELAALEALLQKDEPKRPTVVYISGPRGIGKTALIEEFSRRSLRAGYRICRPGELRPDSHFLSDLMRDEHALVIVETDHPTRLSLFEGVRFAGRYLSALSLETGKAWQGLIIVELESAISQLEDFEDAILLQPLGLREVQDCVTGSLGSVQLEPEVLSWIHSMTGGVPAYVNGLISGLVSLGSLYRSNGLWRFREVEDLRKLENRTVEGYWIQSWRRLLPQQQRTLSLLNLFRSGLSAESLLVAEPQALNHLPVLQARGWLRLEGSRWRAASGEVRQAITQLAEHTATEAAERRLLANGTQLSREQRAILLLRDGSTTEALTEGLWAVSESMRTGDYTDAVDRSKTCLEIAERLSNDAGVNDALIQIARAHLARGEVDLAAIYLEDPRLGTSFPAREHLLGIARRSQGRLAEAKQHLASAIALSETAHDSRTLLLSNADLAEIDWRHGDEASRRSSLERIRSGLEKTANEDGLSDERASLTYQLGSALVVIGRRDEARTILESGLALKPNDHWAMRLANALAAADYYLGRFESALRWIEMAWRRAESAGIDSFKPRIFSNRAGIHYGLGEFRSAVEDHKLSALWARRTGQLYEYLAALSGQAVNLMHLADYDAALDTAKEARLTAERIGNEYEVLKNIEIMALASFLIGDRDGSHELCRLAHERSHAFGASDVKPRLLWLEARSGLQEGRLDDAEIFLKDAERQLLNSRDWEDLPGVQIELEVVRAKRGDVHGAIARIREIVRDASAARALTVELRGAIALGEIVTEREIYETSVEEELTAALGKAAQAGAATEAWQLNCFLGALAEARGDKHRAANRYSQAIRGLREVAGRLKPRNRQLYLQTPHATRLLQRRR